MLKKAPALIFLPLVLFLFSPTIILARDKSTVSDWYIKDFSSEIIVNDDGSLNITEKIDADCGLMPDKHGIFRTLPTFYQKSTTEKISTPVELLSITDFNDATIPYATSKNFFDKTITWQIGDPNKTVTGENFYKISYKVKNAVRAGSDFDELYWNLNGNFWQMEIDSFKTKIFFPPTIDYANTELATYSGAFGTNNDQLAQYSWVFQNTLLATSKRTLLAGEGITISAAFPKGLIHAYTPGFFDQYGNYFFLLLPLGLLYFCLRIWQKYGRDPKLHKSIIAQYEPPTGLGPLETGMLQNGGRLNNKYISATIIDLAVKGFLKIEQLDKKSVLGKIDYKLILIKTEFTSLKNYEKIVIAGIFGPENEIKNPFVGNPITINTMQGKTNIDDVEQKLTKVSADKEKLLSDLDNNFYLFVDPIRQSAFNDLIFDNYLIKTGFILQLVFGITGFIIILASILGFMTNLILGSSLLMSGLILMIFSGIMPQMSQTGAETLWQIRGFKLYMETAEKYREQFNEKENIFEKYLPYAMVFGIVPLWVKKIKATYGEAYFNTYHPYWFYGAAMMSFNPDTFTKSMDQLSQNMSSAITSNPSSSGVGGGGFSGGGGGGGGGGGW